MKAFRRYHCPKTPLAKITADTVVQCARAAHERRWNSPMFQLSSEQPLASLRRENYLVYMFISDNDYAIPRIGGVSRKNLVSELQTHARYIQKVRGIVVPLDKVRRADN